MARLAIFIDGAYLESVLKYEFGGVRIDLTKLVDEIQNHIEDNSPEPVEVLRTYYYNCRPYQSDPPTPEEMDRYSNSRRFEDALRYLPRFEVRLGYLRKSGIDEWGNPVFEQKQVDLLLGIDMALLASKQQVQHVALVAGDGDLNPAVQVLKSEGAIAWLIHGPRQGSDGRPMYSSNLFKAADERFELDEELIDRLRM